MLMARERITAQALATAAGLSRNYLGKRLRDEFSFTANDVEVICAALGVDVLAFLTTSARRMDHI